MTKRAEGRNACLFDVMARLVWRGVKGAAALSRGRLRGCRSGAVGCGGSRGGKQAVWGDWRAAADPGGYARIPPGS